MKPIRRATVFVGLIAVLAAGCTADKQATIPTDLAPRLQRALDSARTAPGVSASVAVGGRIVWAGTSGVADRNARAPLTTKTRFPIASITKNLVAALAVKLAEKGLVSLDSPIERWAPGFPRADRITLRHLLNHTAGFNDKSFFERDADAPWTATEVASLTGEPLCAPGTCKRYSTLGYVLAGMVIESATGQKLAFLLTQEILRPAGMLDTALVIGTVAEGDAVQMYDPRGNPIGGRGEAYLRSAWAGGGAFSTPSDLVRWSSALYSGRILKRSSLDQVLDVSSQPGAGCPRWGCTGRNMLGTERVLIAGRETWGHEGSGHAVLRYFPETATGIAVIQSQDDPEGRGRQAILDAIVTVLGYEERADVYRIDADGTGLTRLTEDPGVDGTPVAWSPDGRSIVFGSARDGGDQEVFVMEADGSGERALTENDARHWGARWTRDGRILFASDRTGEMHLYGMNADATGLEPLPGSKPGDSMPVPSPDGTRIAFTTGSEGTWDLMVMNMDGTARKLVAGGQGSQWWPSWSPDGTRIVFEDDSSGFDIVIAAVDGSPRSTVRVESDPLIEVGSARQPAWSPDGQLIAFIRDGDDLVVVAPDGSGARVVTHDPIRAFGPAWSPTGSMIAFVSSRT